jgi:hypothetical protein
MSLVEKTENEWIKKGGKEEWLSAYR